MAVLATGTITFADLNDGAPGPPGTPFALGLQPMGSVLRVRAFNPNGILNHPMGLIYPPGRTSQAWVDTDTANGHGVLSVVNGTGLGFIVVDTTYCSETVPATVRFVKIQPQSGTYEWRDYETNALVDTSNQAVWFGIGQFEFTGGLYISGELFPPVTIANLAIRRLLDIMQTASTGLEADYIQMAKALGAERAFGTIAILKAYIDEFIANTGIVEQMFALELILRASGVFRSENYAESSGDPSAGFKMTASDGIIRSVGAILKKASVSGSFESDSMDILESLGTYELLAATTGAQAKAAFAQLPSGFVGVSGFTAPGYAGTSGTLKHQNFSVSSKTTTHADPISRLPNGTLITKGTTKRKSTDNGASWTTLSPPALPAVPACPSGDNVWNSVVDYPLQLIGDGIWAFSRKCYETWEEEVWDPTAQWIPPVYQCQVDLEDPSTAYTSSSGCGSDWQMDYTAGYWEGAWRTETYYLTHFYVYVYIGGSWKVALLKTYNEPKSFTGKLAGFSYGSNAFVIADGMIVRSLNTGSTWSNPGTADNIDQDRFITYPGGSAAKVTFLNANGGYTTSDGSSYVKDTSMKPLNEFYDSSNVFLNFGTNVKISNNGGNFATQPLPVSADCVGSTDGKKILKSGSILYIGLAWDAMVKSQASFATTWRFGVDASGLFHLTGGDGYYTIDNVQSSATLTASTTQLFWSFFGMGSRWLKLLVKSGATLFESLIDGDSGSACGYELTALQLAGGIKLKKSIQVTGAGVDLGPLNSLTATTVNATTAYGAVFN